MEGPESKSVTITIPKNGSKEGTGYGHVAMENWAKIGKIFNKATHRLLIFHSERKSVETLPHNTRELYTSASKWIFFLQRKLQLIFVLQIKSPTILSLYSGLSFPVWTSLLLVCSFRNHKCFLSFLSFPRSWNCFYCLFVLFVCFISFLVVCILSVFFFCFWHSAKRMTFSCSFFPSTSHFPRLPPLQIRTLQD